MKEKVLLLGPKQSIVGVLTPVESEKKGGNIAVLLLNAGLIHRVGPSRLHVNLARALSKRGINAVRFDMSGVGDSSARTDNLPLVEVAYREPQEVMDGLASEGFKCFVLMGICSGAYSSLMTACKDDRVIGAVLINPSEFVRDINWAAYTMAHRYWTKSLFSVRAWINLFTGRIKYRRLFATLGMQMTRGIAGPNKQGHEAAENVKDEVKTLLERETRLLFLLSCEDFSVGQLDLLLGDGQDRIEKSIILGADHIFSRISDQQKVIEIICRWTMSVIASIEKR